MSSCTDNELQAAFGLQDALEKSIWSGEANQPQYFLLAEGTLRKPKIHWVGELPKYSGLVSLFASDRFDKCKTRWEVRKGCQSDSEQE